ncbi:MAG: autotransporter domain-containing protein [Methylococcaceae bacterium]|nr:autotransporter domain-containing protein [Methylococcaceae bacterium]
MFTMRRMLQTNGPILRMGGVRETNLSLPAITSVILTILVLLASPMSIAATFVKVSGDNQAATTNTTLSNQLVVAIDCSDLPPIGTGVCGSVTWSSSDLGDAFNPIRSVSSGTITNATAQTSMTLSSATGQRTVTARALGLPATVTFTITATAPPTPVPPPTTSDRQVTAISGQATTINVQANSISQPSHGTAAISGSTIIYTSAAGFVGQDNFTYVGNSSTGNIQVTVQSSTLQNAGQTPTEQSISNALSTINALGTASPALQQQINALNQTLSTPGGAALVAQALQSIAPRQTAAQINNASRLSSSQVSNISSRLAQLHHGATGFNMNGIRLSMNGESVPSSVWSKLTPPSLGGGAAGDTDDGFVSRFSAFVNGQATFGNRVATDLEVGANSHTLALTSGLEYRFTDAFLMGVAFGYGDTSTDYKGQAGKLANTAFSSSLYGSYNITDRFFLDSIFTYTLDDYNSERIISYQDILGTVSERATSKPSGSQHRFTLGGGYDFNFDALTLGLRARTEYGHMEIGQYRETGASGLNLAIDPQKNKSVVTSFGGQISYAISTSFGVLQPQLNLDWEHEFKNNSREVISRFVDDSSGTAFVIRTNDPDRDYLNLQSGISAVLPNGLSAFVQYETLLGYRYGTRHTVNAGVRLEF